MNRDFIIIKAPTPVILNLNTIAYISGNAKSTTFIFTNKVKITIDVAFEKVQDHLFYETPSVKHENP